MLAEAISKVSGCVHQNDHRIIGSWIEECKAAVAARSAIMPIASGNRDVQPCKCNTHACHGVCAKLMRLGNRCRKRLTIRCLSSTGRKLVRMQVCLQVREHVVGC